MSGKRKENQCDQRLLAPDDDDGIVQQYLDSKIEVYDPLRCEPLAPIAAKCPHQNKKRSQAAKEQQFCDLLLSEQANCRRGQRCQGSNQERNMDPAEDREKWLLRHDDLPSAAAPFGLPARDGSE